jgi:PEGA domain
LLELAPGTPPGMAAAVMKALAKNASDRFANMDELRHALVAADTLPLASAAGSGGTRAYPARSASGRTLVGPGPAKAATTFSSVSSQIDHLNPVRKGRSGLVVGALVLAAAGAATFLVVARRGGSGSGHPPVTNPTGESAAAGEQAPGAPAAPSATVTVRFESEPAGVHVFRVFDDRDLGATPLEVKLPRDGGKPVYVFKREGYQDQTLTADLSADRTLRVQLEKTTPIGPAPAVLSAPGAGAEKAAEKGEATPARNPTSTTKRTRKPARSGAATDQDGLATPTF